MEENTKVSGKQAIFVLCLTLVIQDLTFEPWTVFWLTSTERWYELINTWKHVRAIKHRSTNAEYHAFHPSPMRKGSGWSSGRLGQWDWNARTGEWRISIETINVQTIDVHIRVLTFQTLLSTEVRDYKLPSAKVAIIKVQQMATIRSYLMATRR